MRIKLTLISLGLCLSLSSHAVQRLERLTISTSKMKFSDHKTEKVSLEELKKVLSKLGSSSENRPAVQGILVEGTVMNPPSRGMAPTNQNARLKISSKQLDLDKSIVLKPDTYNRIEVPLKESITADNDVSELLLEAESLGLIGDLKISFIIDYNP